MVEFRCPSCSAPLADGMAKCPSCGLPLKPQPAQNRGRTLFAGFLLLSLFAVGTLQAVIVVTNPDEAIPAGYSFGLGSYALEGFVRDSNGTAVANATVSMGPKGPNATTNLTGTFQLAGLPVGVYELNATSDNRTALVTLMVREDTRVDATLPSQGVARVDDPSLGWLHTWLQVCGGFMLGLCLLTLLGTIATYGRRMWGLALAGALAGSLLWLPLSLLLGLVAVILLVKSRTEFT